MTRDVVVEMLADTVRDGRPVTFALTGDSMRPHLAPGARLVVTAVTPQEIRAGDLLVYRAGDRVVCHRALLASRERGRWQFLTSGDARPALVTWVDAADVIGRVATLETDRRRRLDAWPARARAFALAARALWALTRARVRARWQRSPRAPVVERG